MALNTSVLEQITKCLTPELHGLLYDFVKDYVENKGEDFGKFGENFFNKQRVSDRKCSRQFSQSSIDAYKLINTDPAALYKLVECDPDILYLRDKMKSLVLAYLMDSHQDLTAIGVDYFMKHKESLVESDISRQHRVEFRREGVAADSYDPDTDDFEIPMYEKTAQQSEELRGKVQHTLLFRSMDDEQLKKILGAMFKLEIKKGSDVIRQGDSGDYFYVVDSGTFEAYFTDDRGKEEIVTVYKGTGSFGELALLYDLPRVATVRAVTNGTLWCLDRGSFKKIIVQSAFKKRAMYEQFLANVPLLQKLSRYELLTLADALHPMTFEDGECIIKQADKATGMYLVEEGMVLFSYTDAVGSKKKLDKIKKGGYFGELALMKKQPRAVSAYASGFVRLAFIDTETFERLLGPCHEIMERTAQEYLTLDSAT